MLFMHGVEPEDEDFIDDDDELYDEALEEEGMKCTSTSSFTRVQADT